MRVYIIGVDGYLGWSLSQYLVKRKHTIGGCDAFFRREWVRSVGSHSAIPIELMSERLSAFYENFHENLDFAEGDIKQYKFIEKELEVFKPDCIVHLGEMPSAPYSMISVKHAAWTQKNNVIGTLNVLWAMKKVCPEAHLLKLGTMGEYATPNIDIPEGDLDIEFRGRKDTLPFPKSGGSFYHLSKTYDSINIRFCCGIWGLRSTDIMQGPVYGTYIPEMGNDDRLRTRFDMDTCMGTVINRMCAQAVIGHPLTVYGKGGQTRGYLPLKDSMQCLAIALENPPKQGEYRVFNQFEELYSVNELAAKVKKVGDKLGLNVTVSRVENPRIEKEAHYYNPDHQKLLNLGYKPTHDMEAELEQMLKDLIKYRDRIEEKKNILIPETRWDGTKRKSVVLDE